jgi:photosystem II stability/assembly factor-like uncharacterized protein
MRRMRSFRLPWFMGAVASATLLVASGVAHANGRFPAAGQLVVDPMMPDHLILRATFGILESTDRGKHWGWICEEAVGYAGVEDPAMSVTADGSLIAGIFEGLAVSHDQGCSWAFAGGPTDKQYTIDTAIEPLSPSHVVAVTSTGVADGFHVVLAESLDNGKTWDQAGVPAPMDVLAETVEVAPSNPMRVYVSGLDTNYNGVLLRTDDRGKTWKRFAVDLNSGAGLFIGAVDPKDPDRVYARIDNYPSDTLIVSADGGATWKTIYTSEVPPSDAGTTPGLFGFALSPDGTQVAIGGPVDGVRIASTADYAFKPVGTVHVNCLRWAPTGLYACGDEFKDGFTVGVSNDVGKTFAPLYHLSDLTMLSCPANSPQTTLCSKTWPQIASTIGANPSSGAGGSGGAPSSASSPASNGNQSPVATGGCDVSIRGERDAWAIGALLGTFFGAAAARRTRRRLARASW